MHRLRQKGFTLLELIVVITVIGTLGSTMLFLLNPKSQLNKTYDAQRAQDLNTIQTGLDTYFSDHNCYPTTVPFGTTWTDGTTTLLQKTPQDPQANTNGNYVYITNTQSACATWNVIFSKLAATSSSGTCSLPANCRPSDMTDQWSCKVSGTPDCSLLTSQTLTKYQTIASNQTSQNTSVNISQSNAQNTISICHNTGNGTYQQVTTNASSDIGGHDGHTDDIIPPFSYSCFLISKCQYPGKNWTQDNQITYTNGCTVYSNPSAPDDCIYPYSNSPYYQKTCTVDTDQIVKNFTNYIPTTNDGMKANLYNDWGTFVMSNPSFVDQTSTIPFPYYWLDVSINPDFSGKACDPLACFKNHKTYEVGDDCQTVINYGYGTYYEKSPPNEHLTYNNIPITLIYGFHIMDRYYADNSGVAPPDSYYWKYYRTGQKLYFRYRSHYPEDNGKVSPTGEGIVNACVPSKRYERQYNDPYWEVFNDVPFPFPSVTFSDLELIFALGLNDWNTWVK